LATVGKMGFALKGLVGGPAAAQRFEDTMASLGQGRGWTANGAADAAFARAGKGLGQEGNWAGKGQQDRQE
jgi:hypothetical protein